MPDLKTERLDWLCGVDEELDGPPPAGRLAPPVVVAAAPAREPGAAGVAAAAAAISRLDAVEPAGAVGWGRLTFATGL